MNPFADGINNASTFIVKNINARKTVKVMGVNIAPGNSYNLMSLEGVTESDIKVSLLKGVLKRKINLNELQVTSCDLDLTGFNTTQNTFIVNKSIQDSTYKPLNLHGTQLNWQMIDNTLYFNSNANEEVIAINAKAGATTDPFTVRVGGTVVGDITATGAIEIKAMSFQANLTGPNMGGGNGVIAEDFGGSLQIASGAQSNGNIVLTAYDGGAVHGTIHFKTGAAAPTVLEIGATQTTIKNNYRLGFATSSGGAGGGATQPILWLSAGDEVILGGGLSTTGGKLMTAGAGATCLQWGVSGTNIGFLGATPVARQTITGALSTVTDPNAKAVLTSVINALTNLGLTTNSTT